MKLWLRRYADDLLLLAGCGLIVTGVAQVSGPLAWIVAGILLIGLAALIGKAKSHVIE